MFQCQPIKELNCQHKSVMSVNIISVLIIKLINHNAFSCFWCNTIQFLLKLLYNTLSAVCKQQLIPVRDSYSISVLWLGLSLTLAILLSEACVEPASARLQDNAPYLIPEGFCYLTSAAESWSCWWVCLTLTFGKQVKTLGSFASCWMLYLVKPKHWAHFRRIVYILSLISVFKIGQLRERTQPKQWWRPLLGQIYLQVLLLVFISNTNNLRLCYQLC